MNTLILMLARFMACIVVFGLLLAGSPPSLGEASSVKGDFHLATANASSTSLVALKPPTTPPQGPLLKSMPWALALTRGATPWSHPLGTGLRLIATDRGQAFCRVSQLLVGTVVLRI